MASYDEIDDEENGPYEEGTHATLEKIKQYQSSAMHSTSSCASSFLSSSFLVLLLIPFDTCHISF